VSVQIDASQLSLLRGPNDWLGYFKGTRIEDHFSAHSLSRFVECEHEFQRTHIQLAPELPSENLIVGDASHRTLQHNFGQKIESHADLPLAELMEFHDDLAFPLAVTEAEEKADEKTDWKTSRDEAHTRSRLMACGYIAKVGPRIQPISVEQRFAVPMGLPVKMEGRYDLLTETVGIDFKTGAKKSYKPKTSWLLQAMIYSFATGKPVEFHSIACSEKTHDVGIVTPLESEAMLVNLSQAEIDGLTRVVVGIVNEIVDCMRRYGPEEPWPARGRFHIFACDYCSFRSDCPAWAGAA